MPDSPDKIELAGAEGRRLRVTVLPVTARGIELAGSIGALFTEPEIVAPARVKSGGLRSIVKEVWPVSDAIVFICASGIAVRMIAPLLKSKATDPAVLVIDETGNFVISLVSGHLGGANELTKRVATAIGALPVITTATDNRSLPCVEEIAKEFSLAIENLKAILAVNSAILEGGPVLVVDVDRERLKAIAGFVAGFGEEASSVFSFADSMPPEKAPLATVIITPDAAVDIKRSLKPSTMLLRPRRYVAGIGCRRGVSADEIKRAVEAAFKGAGLSLYTLKRVATIDIKRDEAGLLEFADSAGVAIDFFSAVELNSVTAASGSSPVVLKVTGAKAVAEPAALISAKAQSLCLKKIKTKRVTVALAKVPFL